MTTRSRFRLRCSRIVAYCCAIAICLLASYSIRGAVESERIGCPSYSIVGEDTYSLSLSSNKAATVAFSEGAAKVKDCYLYSRIDRLEICTFANLEWAKKGIHGRSVYSLEAEMAAHGLCYRLGMYESSSRDADLEAGGDPRWFVSSITSVIEIIGI